MTFQELQDARSTEPPSFGLLDPDEQSGFERHLFDMEEDFDDE